MGIIADDVQELGALVLHRERERAVFGCLRDRLSGIERQILEHDRVPESWEILAPERAAYASAAATAERDFLDRCLRMTCGMIDDLRQKRNALAMEDLRYLPLVVCGGGRSLPLYQSFVEKHDSWVRAHFGLSGIRRVSTELPGGVPIDHFYRLAVAFGLAQDRSAFERILGPDELPDIPRPPRKGLSSEWCDPDRYPEK